MTKSEAYKKIDNWLLVPVGYESILPALAEIRDADDYPSIIKKVADTAYKGQDEVINDVEKWYQVHQFDKSRQEIIDDKLNELSDKGAGSTPNRPSKETISNYSKYAQKYQKSPQAEKKRENALVQCCPRCGEAMVVQERSGMTSDKIVIYILVFLFCPIIGIIMLIAGYGTKKEKVVRCPHCNR